MSEKKNVLTFEGLRALEAELEDLKINKRREVAEKIKEARGQGDLSENAEYDSAKEEQAEIETRIVKLEKLLKNAEAVDSDELSGDEVKVGCKVALLDVEFNEELTYTIVGSAESDPQNGSISYESPVGNKLIGRKEGEVVDVDTPAGVVSYKILSITI